MEKKINKINKVKKTKSNGEQSKRILNYRGLQKFTTELFKRVK